MDVRYWQFGDVRGSQTFITTVLPGAVTRHFLPSEPICGSSCVLNPRVTSPGFGRNRSPSYLRVMCDVTRKPGCKRKWMHRAVFATVRYVVLFFMSVGRWGQLCTICRPAHDTKYPRIPAHATLRPLVCLPPNYNNIETKAIPEHHTTVPCTERQFNADSEPLLYVDRVVAAAESCRTSIIGVYAACSATKIFVTL